MKRHLSLFAATIFFLFLAAPAWGQFTQVHGKAVDTKGQPITGAEVNMKASDTGRKYTLKTDKKGEFFSLGIQPGTYTVTLMKGGQLLYSLNNVPVTLSAPNGVNEIDFDLAEEAQKGPAAGGPASADYASMTPEQKKAFEEKTLKNMTPEQRKEFEERKKKIEQTEKANATIKTLNAKLQAASAAMQANNYDQAIATLKEANAMDPTHDLIWGRLGDAYAGAKQYGDAADAYQHAIALINQQPPEKQNKDSLGAYQNQLGSALAQGGKVDEAIAAYSKAAELDPAHAARYYFNEGAVMTNVGSRTTDPVQHAAQLKAANDAFDKAIAADPTYAEAYFQKGANGVNMATMDKNGKTIVPPGTAEAFQKYLEIAPTGPHAEEAKQLLTALGEQIQTTYKGGKKK